MYTWTGKPLPLRVSPSDVSTTVRGHRQTHTNAFSDTQSHKNTHHLQRQRQTHRHMETHKHTQRHIETHIQTQKLTLGVIEIKTEPYYKLMSGTEEVRS